MVKPPAQEKPESVNAQLFVKRRGCSSGNVKGNMSHPQQSMYGIYPYTLGALLVDVGVCHIPHIPGHGYSSKPSGHLSRKIGHPRRPLPLNTTIPVSGPHNHRWTFRQIPRATFLEMLLIAELTCCCT